MPLALEGVHKNPLNKTSSLILEGEGADLSQHLLNQVSITSLKSKPPPPPRPPPRPPSRVIMSHLNAQLPHVNRLQAFGSHHNIVFLAGTRQCLRKIAIWKPFLEVCIETWSRSRCTNSRTHDEMKHRKVES